MPPRMGWNLLSKLSDPPSLGFVEKCIPGLDLTLDHLVWTFKPGY